MASLGAALFLPFIPPVPLALRLPSFLPASPAAWPAPRWSTGPLLRKTGAYSLPDLIAARFPHLAARLGAIVMTTAVAILIGLAGYQEALSSLVVSTGFSKPLVAVIIAAISIFIVLPGGLASTLWGAAATTIIALTVFGLPLLITALRGTPLAFPLIGQTGLWSAALVRIDTWTGAAQAAGHMDPILIAVIALGIACSRRFLARRSRAATGASQDAPDLPLWAGAAF